ncbi:MAG: glycoside hydrolase, partial [Acidobacteriota bacterium]|nr:glycoside hydrolase [Acidobacteriota bacterium]
GRGTVSKYHVSTGQTEMVSPAPLRDNKYRTDRTSPIIFSPVEPHTLFYGANVIFKTTDGGHSWQTISPDLTRDKNGIPPSVGSMAAGDQNAEKQRGAVYSLAPSFRSAQTLWAGTDEGLLWVTRNGGANWKNVTPKELTPWSKVTQMEAGHFDDLTAYASVSRLRVDDLRPYLYRTHDGGRTWVSIANGLPDDAPVDTVREDPVRRGLLFAGTEKSVWFSMDDGDHWQSLQLNLPHTSMRDLWIKDADLIVATHGRAFWILDGITPLRQLEAKAMAGGVWLAKPAQAWRVRENNNTDTPTPPDEPYGENPPDGAVIDYFLAEKSDAVKIEILDSAGRVVRKYASDDAPEISEAGIRKLGIPAWWIQQPKAPSKAAGMHRWLWDLRYTAPESTRHEYPIAAVPGRTPRVPRGPQALPGIYTVKLTAGGKTLTSRVTVKMDPRLKTAPAALQQNFQLQRKLAGLMTSSTEAIREARGVLEQVAKVKGGETEALQDLQKKTRETLAALTRSNSQATGLYNDVGSADMAPTAAEMTASSVVARELGPLLEQWEAIANEDIPALNEKLKAANLPAIKVEENDKEGDTDTADDDDDVG